MSGAITVDVQPGYYLENQTINVTFTEEVKEVAINKDGSPPSISKYISYDTLNPPNPFISVTEDGAGRVVYDGGFPKFYNDQRPSDALVAFHDAIRIDGTLPATPNAIVLETVLIDHSTSFKDGSIRSQLGTDIIFTGSTSNPADNGQFKVVFIVVELDGTVNSFSSRNTNFRVNNLSELRMQVVTNNVTTATNISTYIKDLKMTTVSTNRTFNILGVDSIIELDYLTYTGSMSITQFRKASSFDQMTPSFKYMINVFDWILDPIKEREGNRRILVIGDSVGNYRVGVSGNGHFYDSLQTLFKHGNYKDSTVKERTAWPGSLIDVSLAELQQYSAVFMMGSQHGTVAYITQNAIDNIVRYRELGGGVFLMTDHGPVLNTIQQAIGTYGAAFFTTVNKIATRFGAWFSGDYNRTPVNVGFLRSNYGDHPLYKNMTDAESIFAGGSESRVFVTSDPTYGPEQVTRQYTTKSGYNVINIMCIMDDGSMVPVKLEYNIVDYTTLFMINGNSHSSGTMVDVGIDNFIHLAFEHLGSNVTTSAEVRLNGVRIGNMSRSAGNVPVFTPVRFDNGKVHINNGSVITLAFSNPAGMQLSIVIKRGRISLEDTKNLLYPNYDKVLTDILKGTNLPTERIKRTLSVEKSVRDLAKSLDYTKMNLATPYGDGPATFILKPMEFPAPSLFRGFFHDSGNLKGSLSPLLDQTVQVRDMNSPIGEPTLLQFGYYGTATPPIMPIAIYVDNNGPLYLVQNSNDSGARRYFYGDGVFDVFRYLGTKLNQDVEIRFVYPD